MTKPPILEVIGKRIELQRVGQRWRGLCPFHSEKTPSFTVSEDKGFFYCFGCQEHGDVITFAMKIDGVGFKEAISRLGISGAKHKPRPRANLRTHHAAALMAGWMNDQHLKVGALLRELSRQITLAGSIPDPELVESLSCEWEILSDSYEDLQNPEYTREIWEARESIESITRCAEPEPLPEFPELTPEYLEYLKAAVTGVLC